MPEVQEISIPVDVDADCSACAERLREGIQAHRGIAEVRAAPDGRALTVRYDPEQCSLECVGQAADALRLRFAERFSHEVLPIDGMDCADCAQTIERALGRVSGVSQAEVSFPAASMRVEYEPALVRPADLVNRVESLGYRVRSAAGAPGEGVPAAAWWRGREARSALAALLLGVALTVDLTVGAERVALAGYLLAIVTGGWPIARSGLAAARATLRPDINLLMSIAVVGAAAIGAWVEAAFVVVLFSVGAALESRAVERARRELAGLVSLTPQSARVRRAYTHADGAAHAEEVEISVADLVIGDEVVILPGERLPADGRIIEGSSAIDQSTITGESTPVDRRPGDPVFAGTVNAQGRLVVEVTSAPGDTTVEKIGRLVAEAQARKSPSERWVDAFARVYTPAVIVAAVVVGVVSIAFGVGTQGALYSALALLILACPCALVISTPVAIVSALGRASAAGVLIRGGEHLEKAASVSTVAFDKTGTLTTGRPRVAVVEPLEGAEDDVLALAASLEQGSEHPLARAIVEAAHGRGLVLAPIREVEALVGLGARGLVDGERVEVGSPRMFEDASIPEEVGAAMRGLAESGRTVVVVARAGRPVGLIGLADEPRASATEAIAALGRLGIRRTILLSGDNVAVATAVARRLGVTDVRAHLLPQEKASEVAALDGVVAMVGDGINDAPALAQADLGIAMGSAGSDAAVEVADVALMGDDPRSVAGLIGLARWSRAVVRQNVAFALITKLAALGLLVAGALPLWAAVVSDVGASLIVVANGLRLLRGAPRGSMTGAPILAAPGRRPALDEVAVRAPLVATISVSAGCGDGCCTPGDAGEQPASGSHG